MTDQGRYRDNGRWLVHERLPLGPASVRYETYIRETGPAFVAVTVINQQPWYWAELVAAADGADRLAAMLLEDDGYTVDHAAIVTRDGDRMLITTGLRPHMTTAGAVPWVIDHLPADLEAEVRA